MEAFLRIAAWCAIAIITVVSCTLLTAAGLLALTELWPQGAAAVDQYQSLLGALIAIPVSGVAIYATLRAGREQMRAAERQRAEEHFAKIAAASGEMIQRTMSTVSAIDHLEHAIKHSLLESLQKIEVPELERCLKETADSCVAARARLESVPVNLQAIPLVQVHITEACIMQLRKMLTFCQDHVGRGIIPPERGLNPIGHCRPSLAYAEDYFKIVVLAGGNPLADPVKDFYESKSKELVEASGGGV